MQPAKMSIVSPVIKMDLLSAMYVRQATIWIQSLEHVNFAPTIALSAAAPHNATSVILDSTPMSFWAHASLAENPAPSAQAKISASNVTQLSIEKSTLMMVNASATQFRVRGGSIRTQI